MVGKNLPKASRNGALVGRLHYSLLVRSEFLAPVELSIVILHNQVSDRRPQTIDYAQPVINFPQIEPLGGRLASTPQ